MLYLHYLLFLALGILIGLWLRRDDYRKGFMNAWVEINIKFHNARSNNYIISIVSPKMLTDNKEEQGENIC